MGSLSNRISMSLGRSTRKKNKERTGAGYRGAAPLDG